jgi:hypothetical protein
VICFCVSENDGRKHDYGAVHIGTSGEPVSGIEVYHNTLVTTATPGGRQRALWIGGGANEGIRVRNNLLVARSAARLVEIEAKQTGVLFQGNAYWSGDGPFLILDDGRAFDGLAAWRAATGQERLDGRDVGLVADPGLGALADRPSGPTSGDEDVLRRVACRLLAGSPLLGRAVDLQALGLDPGPRDLDGVPLRSSGPPDIGACQGP